MKLIAAFFLTMIPLALLAEGQVHQVAVHVDQNDPKVMNMALNNVNNLTRYFQSRGDTVKVELVAYGPGLDMFVANQSPVAARISQMSLENEGLTFSACGNTIKGHKKAGKDITLLSDVEVVPSGVARLVELQEQGYSYVRP